MSSGFPSRLVYLKVVSDTLSPDAITKVVGAGPDEAIAKGTIPPGSVTKRPLSWNRWELREAGDGACDIDSLLRALYDRLVPIRDGLLKLPREESKIELVIVAYHSAEDGASHGFHLDGPLINFIADIGADIDVDQYVLDEE